MTQRLRRLLKKIMSSKGWRFVLRNMQIKLLGSLLFIILFLILIISLVEIRVNEDFNSFSDIFYWAIITITTVGYGDITPQTTVGHILTPLMIIIGVVLVSFMTATIASILTATRIREGMGLKKIELDGHIVLCGYNFNIERVIKSIISASPVSPPEIILVNEHDEAEITNLIERFPETPIRFVNGDYSLESTLNRASITNASSAIILADAGPDGTAKPDDRTLLTVLAIKSMSQEVRVCVELLDDTSEVHLRRAGVDQIILSGEFSGFLLANAVMSPGIPQALKEIMYVDVGSEILREKMPSGLIGKTFREAAVEYLERSGLILIGVITEKKSFSLDTILDPEEGAIDEFIKRKFDEAGRSLETESKSRITVKINPGNDYIISEYDYAIIITSDKEKTVV